MNLSTLLVVLAAALLDAATGANILAIVPLASHSHHIWNRVLTLELARRGHNITILTPDLEKTPVPNVAEILIEGSYEYQELDYKDRDWMDIGSLSSILQYFTWGVHGCETEMNSNGTKALLSYPDGKVFDLIIIELSQNECFLPFIEKFGSPPTIGVSAFLTILSTNYIFGNPEPFAYSPNLFLRFTDRMTFLQRLTNTIFNLFTDFYRTYVYLPRVKKIAEQHFGRQVSPLENIERKISIFFDNSIIGIDFPRPIVPSIIGVGGIHLKRVANLPQDLQEYMDNAENGVILFTLGSNLRSEKLDKEKRDIIMKAFSELPQKILWKFESENLPGKPENVRISKWLPQSEILAHPNVKLFITHCGILSYQEAIYRGVPIVGLPFYLDQHTNLHKAINLGFGEGFKFSELTQDKLRTAINKVLSNKTYYENVKRLSTIFHEQPEHPLDRAVYWTEYVLRHNGAPHLRSAALDLEWYQYFLLDVIAVLILAVILFLWIIIIIARLLLKFSGRKKLKQN